MHCVRRVGSTSTMRPQSDVKISSAVLSEVPGLCVIDADFCHRRSASGMAKAAKIGS